MTTPNLSLPELVASQSQPHITLNQALRRLDALVQLSVLSISNTPPGSPADGDRYIIGSSPTGAWAGHGGEVAAYIGSGWVYWPPGVGWLAFVQSLAVHYVYGSGSPAGWEELVAGGGGGGGGGAPLAINEYFEFKDDFNYHNGISFGQTWSAISTFWRQLFNGNNTIDFTSVPAEARHPGIQRTAIGNGSYTIFALTNDQNSDTYNQWFVSTDTELTFETLVRFDILPSGTEDYYMSWGLQDVNNSTEAILITLLRDSGVNKWQCLTKNDSTSTTNLDTTVTPVDDQWHHLKFVATPTEVLFYVDGTLIATHTTNIPDEKMTIFVIGIRVTGSTYRYIDMDYVSVVQNFIGGR